MPPAVQQVPLQALARQRALMMFSKLGVWDTADNNGVLIYLLLAERKIENVIILGVHLNMCVSGRPFGLRQMAKNGKHVVLMRDMTDTMYNPERPPGVSHFEGTDLVIEHVEKYWCPSFTSTDITGKPAFRFKDDQRTAPRN